MTSFDAVLCKTDLCVLFNGTPEKTREWLEKNVVDDVPMIVAPGTMRNTITVEEYLGKK